MSGGDIPAILIVPGLRDHVADHWQTHLATELSKQGRAVRTVPPTGREDLDCGSRVIAIEREARTIDSPIVIVAHSGGVVVVVHWARQTRRQVLGALLAAPPDFDTAMPDGYPTLDALRAGGWLSVPRGRLPFPSIVAGSRNDPLASYERVAELAGHWGSALVDLGEVGHLNPASGFGRWPDAEHLIEKLSHRAA